MKKNKTRKLKKNSSTLRATTHTNTVPNVPPTVLLSQQSQKPQPKTSKFLPLFVTKKFFWFVLLLIGINMMVLGFIYLQYQKTILSFQVSPVTQVALEYRQSDPVKIEIESHKIDLPITQAQIKDGIWETSDKTATHLNTSARPGEKGNIVIYGHNRRHLFARLRQVKKDDKIKVKNKDGKTYEYTVTSTETVKPDNISVVLPTDYEVLTLYTCTGFMDSHRFIVKATPTGVSSE